MTKLEKVFTYKGDKFTMHKESKTAYIYKRMHGNTAYYEVFGIRVSEILKDFENKIGSGEFKERYPKDNDFGVWAWCFANEETAVNKFNELNKTTINIKGGECFYNCSDGKIELKKD
jgi:hypothetical protein